jgi:YidC/Oxa1 family membrane protein insertase
MKSNFILALVLSFTVLVVWETVFMKGQRNAPRPVVSAPAAPQGSAPAAGPERERLVELVFGQNRLSFNLFGASVRQWWFEETKKGGRWIPLVVERGFDVRPFSTFPDTEFKISRHGPDEVVFEGQREDGLWIQKRFHVSPVEHIHQVTMVLENRGKDPVEAGYALGWGPGIGSGDGDPKEEERSQRALAFDPPRLMRLKPSTVEGDFQWWGVDARYFLAAFLNQDRQKIVIETQKIGKFPVVQKPAKASLAAGAKSEETLRFYVGPKGYAQLASLNLGLERAVDFGTFGGLGKLVLRTLYFFHRITHNYGWAIILLTVVIQLLAAPLTVKSFRHGQKMKVLQPQVKRLQELYKGDPKRLNVEMMNLYRRHGMKFMGMEGCLPILIQLPVFYALYTTLHNAYELRNAPWIGWIQDLSFHDPYYVLPVIMGVGMLLQQKMTMSAVDPIQARMMYIFPVIMIFIFIRMPAGLVLYWCTSSLMSILIQGFLLRQAKVQKENAI